MNEDINQNHYLNNHLNILDYSYHDPYKNDHNFLHFNMKDLNIDTLEKFKESYENEKHKFNFFCNNDINYLIYNNKIDIIIFILNQYKNKEQGKRLASYILYYICKNRMYEYLEIIKKYVENITFMVNFITSNIGIMNEDNVEKILKYYEYKNIKYNLVNKIYKYDYYNRLIHEFIIVLTKTIKFKSYVNIEGIKKLNNLTRFIFNISNYKSLIKKNVIMYYYIECFTHFEYNKINEIEIGTMIIDELIKINNCDNKIFQKILDYIVSKNFLKLVHYLYTKTDLKLKLDMDYIIDKNNSLINVNYNNLNDYLTENIICSNLNYYIKLLKITNSHSNILYNFLGRLNGNNSNLVLKILKIFYENDYIKDNDKWYILYHGIKNLNFNVINYFYDLYKSYYTFEITNDNVNIIRDQTEGRFSLDKLFVELCYKLNETHDNKILINNMLIWICDNLPYNNKRYEVNIIEIVGKKFVNNYKIDGKEYCIECKLIDIYNYSKYRENNKLLDSVLDSVLDRILDCAICLDNDKRYYIKYNCNHIFCNDCTINILENNGKCPYCRKVIDINKIDLIKIN